MSISNMSQTINSRTEHNQYRMAFTRILSLPQWIAKLHVKLS